MRVRVLLNPKAGSGSSLRRLPAILRELTAAGVTADSVETRGPGNAAQLVREAYAEGVDCVAIVGGDGTLNEAVQAFIGADGKAVSGPVLGLIPAGTGGDFRRTFGLGHSVEEAVARLLSSPPRPVDLGLLRLEDEQGREVHRAFVNVTSFGISGLTDRIVNGSPKWIGGRAAFFLGASRASLAYRNQPVRVMVDEQLLFEGPIFNVAVANGRYFGGGMKIAPEADPSDGVFDVVAMCDLSWFEGVSLSRHIYGGSHLTTKGVRSARGTRISAEPLSRSEAVLIDMDGETPGRLPLEVRIAPASLRIRI